MSKGNRTRRRAKGLLPPPLRCSAHNRHGEPCKKWAVNGATVCEKHGGNAPQVRQAAERRLASKADLLMRELIRIATSAESEAVRLAAVRDALDRIGIGAKQSINVTVAPWQESIDGILIDTAPDPDAEVIDGEVIENEEPDEPRGLPSLMDDPPRYGRGSRVRGR